MSKKIEIKKGDRYGFLIIKKEILKKNKGRFFECVCVCGKLTEVHLGHLRIGHTTSCGCKKSAKVIKHGMTGTRTYSIWVHMIQRCINPKNERFSNYGGRGIKVCKKWMKFENFYKDMGETPNKHSIDRINNDGNYCKKNCRWATNKEQARNKTTNVLIYFKGETKPIIEWAEKTGLRYYTLLTRLRKYNWSVERALITPTGNYIKSN